MSRILITGGAGFIGANFIHYWQDRYPQDRVVTLDALTYAGNRANLVGAEAAGDYQFVHGDIRNQTLVEDLLRSYQIDTIVHFAAESHVDRSISGPDAFVDVNIVGTHSLLKAARSVWLADSAAPHPGHRFHHVSTDEVYGSLESEDPAFTESTPYSPNSPYAASKAASDHLVRAYQHTYGLATTMSNCSNNYGPYQFPEKLIPLLIVNLLEGKPLPIYGDGLNIRDWLFVEDHCRGIDLVLKGGAIGRTYNIGTDNELTNLDLVHTLCDLVDRLFAEDPSLCQRFASAPPAAGKSCTSAITFVKDRLGHDRRYAIDRTRIASELGFRPEITFDEGLLSTVRWYLENEDWWRSVMDESYRHWVDHHYTD
jgi:dTDP-glucose 4,6-dehydratase